MPLQLLSAAVRSYLRSGVAVTCMSQCAEELVHNSIDAGAESIAVHVDVPQYMIQVVDNGAGITPEDLKVIGQRYSTSKCHSLSDLTDLRYYGYRGEALASILDVSGSLEISTRPRISAHPHIIAKTYRKAFRRGYKVEMSESSLQRAYCGTTVTVHDFFYNLPVRQRNISESLEIESIKKTLTAIALVNPSISFTLWNGRGKDLVLTANRASTISGRISQLFNTTPHTLEEVALCHKGFQLSGYLSTNGHHNKSLQYVFVNRRVVRKTKIQASVNNVLANSLIVRGRSGPDRHGVYIICIRCPVSQYDITLEPNKSLVEFKDWGNLLQAVHMLLNKFLTEHSLTCGLDMRPCGSDMRTCDRERSPLQPAKSCDSHTINFGLHSRIVKRLKGPHTPSDTPPLLSSLTTPSKSTQSPSTSSDVTSDVTGEQFVSKKRTIGLNVPKRAPLPSTFLSSNISSFMKRSENVTGEANIVDVEKKYGDLIPSVPSDGNHGNISSALHNNCCNHSPFIACTASSCITLSSLVLHNASLPYTASSLPCITSPYAAYTIPLSSSSHIASPQYTLSSTVALSPSAPDVRVTHSVSPSSYYTTSVLPTSAVVQPSLAAASIDHCTFDHGDQEVGRGDKEIDHNVATTVAPALDTASGVWKAVSANGSTLYINRVTGNISHTQSHADTSVVTYGHAPLLAAPHLTHGYTPLKPRPKALRHTARSNTGITDINDTTNVSDISDISTKWRDVGGRLISSWKNPAFMAGDKDVLSIDKSSCGRGSIHVHNLINPRKFTKELFNDIKILGQVDNKFILCHSNTPGSQSLIVCFDQHAVHERIRVETLTHECYEDVENRLLRSTSLSHPLSIKLSSTEAKLAMSYSSQLSNIGLSISHRGDDILVHSVPTVLLERAGALPLLVHDLLVQHVAVLHSTSGGSRTLPSIIQRVLNSTACHGAIKFGDPLTYERCQELISSLSQCQLPFQCAHGRPSVVPLVDVGLLTQQYSLHHHDKLSISKLRTRRPDSH